MVIVHCTWEQHCITIVSVHYGKLQGAASVRAAVSQAKRYLIEKAQAPCGSGLFVLRDNAIYDMPWVSSLGTEGPLHYVFNISHRITLNYWGRLLHVIDAVKCGIGLKINKLWRHNIGLWRQDLFLLNSIMACWQYSYFDIIMTTVQIKTHIGHKYYTYNRHEVGQLFFLLKAINYVTLFTLTALQTNNQLRHFACLFTVSVFIVYKLCLHSWRIELVSMLQNMKAS